MLSGEFIFHCTLSFVIAGFTGMPVQDQQSGDTVLTETQLTKYVTVRLDADLTHLSDSERKIIGLLIEAAREMDEAFWYQAWGDREEKLAAIPSEKLRDFARVNYGPWDRLQNMRSFVPGIGAKSAGANFYPADMTQEEFLAAVIDDPALGSLYTFVRRDEKGKLHAVPYGILLKKQFSAAAAKLREAARLSDVVSFGNYLNARADALESGEYQQSDRLWMDMKDNRLDIVIGPIETYEDQLFGKKAACEALREASASIEEGKADILGLFMVTQLLESGDLTEGELADYYVTFVAGIFRSVRFGAGSAHGRANMVCFNFLSQRGAFARDAGGRYLVNVAKMKVAVGELAGTILQLQGQGDYAAAREFADTVGQIGPVLAADLERVNRQGIPTDIVFEQGPEVLGLVPTK